jgi:ceramide glucosyltransferase
MVARVVILLAIAAAAGVYQLIALVACLAFRRGQGPGASQKKPRGQTQGVSILKPVHGVDGALREAIRSHTVLEGEYEFLCGVREGDPAAEVIAEFPRARLIPCTTVTPNRKVGSLIDLARAARYPILVVNDADIRVEPDYLSHVTAPLSDPTVGLVTCMFRPEGDTQAARFEALGVATDLVPSMIVARALGVKDFASGATMAFRRSDLERIGGFEAIADYLADDYQLGHRIHGLGLKCVLSDTIVATHLGGDWNAIWAHQVRWARTVRVSKFWGYVGLPLAFASMWAVALIAAGHWGWALLLLAIRMAMATAAGWVVLRSPDVLRMWVLIPIRDLFTAAAWAAGLFGRTVLWRGQCLPIDREGRIQNRG